jgi:hypothetical protein
MWSQLHSQLLLGYSKRPAKQSASTSRRMRTVAFWGDPRWSLKMDALAIFRTCRVVRPRPPERKSCTGLRIRFNDRDFEDATNCSRPQDRVCLRTRSWHSGEPALTLAAGMRIRGTAGPRCFHGLSLRAVSPAPMNRRAAQPASLWGLFRNVPAVFH